MPDAEPFDVAVIGAGFGGLGAALASAERGAKVAVCEALNYPGGCASTFRRDGYQFEAGATLFSGLLPKQLFGAWSLKHGFAMPVDWIDPLVELRASGLQLDVHRDRAAFLSSLEALPAAPVAGLRAFFAQQEATAGTLWALFDDPALLPPFSGSMVLRHLWRAPRYAVLLPLLGRPLGALLERHGLGSFGPLRTWLDAVCQITVQCPAAEAEACFALSALDYFWRGTGHVRGGIGVLARGLCTALTGLGAEVRLGDRVKSLRREDGRWRLETRRGTLVARSVVANVLPGDLQRLLGAEPPLPALTSLEARVQGGWGAAMLYRVVRPPAGAGAHARHLQLIGDSALPLQDGNHVFASISGEADEGRAPTGLRTLTLSTHVPLAGLHGQGDAHEAAVISEVQERMRETLRLRAPEWCAEVVHELPASPRTFERFTRRANGAVGGVPRRAGLANYAQLGPQEVERGLWLAGDSVFPGQSTYATAVGGVRTAEAIARGA